MYAVIAIGGKQYRVEEGQHLDVELLNGQTQVDLAPTLIVDGDDILATPEQLTGATVSATVVGGSRGPKINGFTYKSKSRVRRRWGHRQKYSTIEITSITRS
jgi:large subunit ribosomal protein L21